MRSKLAGLLLKPKVFLYCAKYTEILFVISLGGILYKHGAHIVVGAQIFVRLFWLLRSGSVFHTVSLFVISLGEDPLLT